MKPTVKSPAVNIAIDALLGVSGGRTTAITGNVCIPPPIGCGGSATTFKDDASRREFAISGLCQKCQDSIFG